MDFDYANFRGTINLTVFLNGSLAGVQNTGRAATPGSSYFSFMMTYVNILSLICLLSFNLACVIFHSGEVDYFLF